MVRRRVVPTLDALGRLNLAPKCLATKAELFIVFEHRAGARQREANIFIARSM